jgi:chromosome segregation ATPase
LFLGGCENYTQKVDKTMPKDIKKLYNSGMSDFATKLDVKAVSSDVQDVRLEVQDVRSEVREIRLEVQDLRSEVREIRLSVDTLTFRVGGLEMRFGELEGKIDRNHSQVLDRIDGFLKRTDDAEQEEVARDAQLNRHERWIKQVAKKINTELEY